MSGRASATVGPAEEDSGPDSPSRKGAWAAGSGTSGTSGEHSAGRKSPDTAGSAGSAAGHDKGGGLLGSIAHVPETIHNVVHNVEEHVHMPHVHVPEVHVPGSGIGGMFQSKKKDHKDKDKDKDREKDKRKRRSKSSAPLSRADRKHEEARAREGRVVARSPSVDMVGTSGAPRGEGGADGEADTPGMLRSWGSAVISTDPVIRITFHDGDGEETPNFHPGPSVRLAVSQ